MKINRVQRDWRHAIESVMIRNLFDEKKEKVEGNLLVKNICNLRI